MRFLCDLCTNPGEDSAGSYLKNRQGIQTGSDMYAPKRVFFCFLGFFDTIEKNIKK